MTITSCIFKRVFLLTLLLIPIFLFITDTVSAQSFEESEKKLSNIRKNIADLEQQLEETKGKEKTLQAQLKYIDTQTTLTNLKITETNTQIEKLEKEILDLSSRITRLSTTLDSISEILIHRIIQTYKYGNQTTLELLFSSENLSDLLSKAKYIQVAQANDKKVLYQLQATKSTYNDQKTDRQTRQKQQEKLKADLQIYQTQMAEQKKAKNQLLQVTKNDESRFQSLIAQLKAEQESITKAISNIGVKVGPVTKGQQIAAMGSTGCSTGPHLHFEVFENAKIEGGKILGSRVNPHNYLGSGRLGSPLKGYPGDQTVITTEYGEIYFLGTHSGLDIAPRSYEGSGRAIYAAESGIAYSTTAPCNLKISGGSSMGKGVIIDHQNGLITLYWHVL